MNSISAVKTPYNQTVLLGTRWGQMLALACDPYQTASLGFYGEWAREESALTCSLLKLGDVALDVGANIGSMTLPMARKVGPTGLVLAFEPQRAPFYCLCANIALNHLLNSVRALNAAASDFDGAIEVPIVDVNKPFNVGGVRLDDPVYDDATKLQKEEVPCFKIDSMNLPRVDFIKIDVETMESKVLAGASETIDRCKPVIIAEALHGEISTWEEENIKRMKELFKSHGYDARQIQTKLFSPDNVRYCQDVIFPGCDHNMIAIPNEREKPEWFLKLPSE